MFEHILVPLDESVLAELVLPHVSAIARLSGARVTVLRVLEPPRRAGFEQPTDPVEWEFVWDQAGRYLAKVCDGFAKHGVAASAHILEGEPATNIIAFARDSEVDLLAMTSHGRSGLAAHNLGGVCFKSILRARTSLLLVRAFSPEAADPVADSYAPRGYHRVLVPMDRSQRAESALSFAVRMAESRGGAMHFMHAVRWGEVGSRVPLDDGEAMWEERFFTAGKANAESYLDRLRHDLAGAGLDISTTVLVHPDPATALSRLAQEEGSDLIAMSAHGLTGSSNRPLGSVTLNSLLYGTTSLLVIQDREPHELEDSPTELAARERQGHA